MFVNSNSLSFTPSSISPVYSTALVLTGGSFASAMAKVLSHHFARVIVKVRSLETYESLLKGENKHYLPGINLPSNIVPALTWEEVDSLTRLQEGDSGVGKIELLVSGLPTSAIRSFCIENGHALNRYLEAGVPFVSLTKGIDPETLQFPDELYFEHFHHYQDQFCFLSGPSFAREILEEQMTLVALAGRQRKILSSVTQMLSTHYFKVFPTHDVKGLLLGGALKNVLAIAGGIVEGLGYNHNTRAALITTGIMDMLSFGVVFNARPETFYGLSGMGDLILSTTGNMSRNKWFGLQVAAGLNPETILSSHKTVVEGYLTTMAVHRLAQKFDIRCPIFEGIYRVLFEGERPEQVMSDLWKKRSNFS